MTERADANPAGAELGRGILMAYVAVHSHSRMRAYEGPQYDPLA